MTVNNVGDPQCVAEERFERIPELVNGDDNLIRRGRRLTSEFLVVVGGATYHLTVSDGRLVRLERGPMLMRSWRFAIRAEAPFWLRFWEPVPEAGYHDLFALSKQGLLTIEGDLFPFMANLQYVKDVLAAPRKILEA